MEQGLEINAYQSRHKFDPESYINLEFYNSFQYDWTTLQDAYSTVFLAACKIHDANHPVSPSWRNARNVQRLCIC